MRALISAEPPGAKATIIRIGFAGYDVARADVITNGAHAQRIARDRTRFSIAGFP
jgi:hypothetical protein